jgi:hypothetical protein
LIDDGFGDFVEEEVGVVGDDADDFEFGFFADAAADGVGGFEEDCGEFLVDEDAVFVAGGGEVAAGGDGDFEGVEEAG